MPFGTKVFLRHQPIRRRAHQRPGAASPIGQSESDRLHVGRPDNAADIPLQRRLGAASRAVGERRLTRESVVSELRRLPPLAARLADHEPCCPGSLLRLCAFLRPLGATPITRPARQTRPAITAQRIRRVLLPPELARRVAGSTFAGRARPAGRQFLGECQPKRHTVSCVDAKDGPHYVELLRLLGQVDGWLARIDPDADRPRPSPGSPLIADDGLLHPYELSHAVWHSLSHAVDHLNCLHALLKDAHVIHMYAPYSLIRSALENACAAVWMLQPARRADRVSRRLRFATNDIRNGEDAKRLIDKVGPRSERERIDQVRDIAKRAGVQDGEAVRKVGYWEIVKAASSTLGTGATLIPFSWKLCSGMTHGDYWTTWGAAERVELPGAPPGLGTFKITANVQMLMYVTTFAADMTKLGWHLYDLRSRPPF